MENKRMLAGDDLLQTYEIINEEDYQQAEQTLLMSQTSQIKEEFGKQLEEVNNSLPSTAEQFTWAMQLAEALAWQNTNAEAKETIYLPLIDALREARGLNETREILTCKILANYEDYINQIVPLLGEQKQELNQLIKSE